MSTVSDARRSTPAVAEPLSRARLAVETAAHHAADVDRNARFPAEAIAALREQRLLSACAPVEVGGDGAALGKLTAIAEVLAGACSSTAMIWAMHQIQLACLVQYGDTPELRRFTRRACAEQLLLASATSEVGTGGDLRSSIATLEPGDVGSTVDKKASTISYGAYSDGILATVRSGPDSAPNDQVLVLVLNHQAELEQLSEWDALGMRGTCSAGFRLRAPVSDGHVLPTPFERIANRTMVPYSHLLWAACWLGIAGSALGRARNLLRERTRRDSSGSAVALTRLAQATARLGAARSATTSAAAFFDRMDTPEDADAWATAIEINEVKYIASQTAVETTLEALAICGFPGYLEHGRYSVARHMRDVLSGPLMISNDRLLVTNGGLLLSIKDNRRPW
ncbi:acyl-CoA dehydrogenase family protein [Streptosporangium sp. NPDC006013]|uniref:acyl-CoA dehydrogenase family protein n=1 Tax=Streptosporangium sp. NPDC006013 TaxID=3155596 RepID=UPI0033A273E0